MPLARLHAARDLGAAIVGATALGMIAWVALTVADVTRGDLLSYDGRTKRFDRRTRAGDSRYPWYLATYGAQVGRRRACELDAMNPNGLGARLEEAIGALIDWPTWERSRAAEAAEPESLRLFLPGWNGQA